LSYHLKTGSISWKLLVHKYLLGFLSEQETGLWKYLKGHILETHIEKHIGAETHIDK